MMKGVIKHKSVKIKGSRGKRVVCVVAILLFVAAACGTFTMLYNDTINKQIRARDDAFRQLADTTAQQIEAIKMRKAAELKAKQEADANEAAEAARSSQGSDASTVDSSKCNTATVHNNPDSVDVLVNKKHCLQPVTFAPKDLVTSNGATLSAKAIPAYNQLFAAAAAVGQGFYVTSSYRSYNDQVSTYNYWVGTSGQAGADTYSARPGYSEHQTGLAFDVAANGCVLDCFGSTSQYQWLQQNAANYGFIQRYYAGSEAITGYKAEEWHYRYVGVQIAKDMKAKGVKTLEEYWGLAGGSY